MDALVTKLSSDSGARKAGAAGALLAIYLFMLYSRVFEATMLIGVPNIYLMLVLSVIALFAVIFKGGFVRAARTPAGLLIIAFTVWAAMILPFSSWKSESLHELTDVWLKSASAFFIIVGLTTAFAHSRKAFSAMGYGAAVSAVLLAATNHYYRDRVTSFGSLGNANEVAFHIAFGLPFLFLLISRVNVAYKVPLLAIALLSLALAVKTASRAGLIITGAIVIVALLKVSFANKFKIIALGAVAVIIGLLAAEQSQLERYKTIFGSSDSSAEALSAEESAASRKHKLEQSIALTLAHPLTGVGMGVFIPAAAELSKEQGETQDWLASHNSYTQISSETGIFGFLLIVGVFALTLRSLLKLHRTAQRLKLKDVQSMALCMLLSSIALAIHFFFDAIAYEFYLPMVAGLSTSLVYAARPLIAEAESLPMSDTGTKSSEPLPVSAKQTFAPVAGEVEILTGNLYKFGRRRAPYKPPAVNIR